MLSESTKQELERNLDQLKKLRSSAEDRVDAAQAELDEAREELEKIKNREAAIKSVLATTDS